MVPTIGFKLCVASWLYGLIAEISLDQRHNQPDGGVGRAPLPVAFPWDDAPGYMIRDRDRIYGTVVTRRSRAMGIGTNRLHQPTLAERLCRTADRIHPARVFGPMSLFWARHICAEF